MQFAEKKWKCFTYFLIIHCSNDSVENINLNAWTENFKIYVFFFFNFKFQIRWKILLKKKLLKMEMSDLSDERNLDKSKVLSV